VVDPYRRVQAEYTFGKIVSFLCLSVSPAEWITSFAILPYTLLAIAIEYKSHVFWYSYLWRGRGVL
jgi:hypothetical protein